MTRTEILKAIATVQTGLFEMLALDQGDADRLRKLRTELENAKADIREYFTD